MEIYAILDGHVLPYILEANFEDYLPIIPPNVAYINITWKSGHHKYYYEFEDLRSLNNDILLDPMVSVALNGRIPTKPQVFSIHLRCSGLTRGIATLILCLVVKDHKGSLIPGLPLRLRLQKQCSQNDAGSTCDAHCSKGQSTCSYGYLRKHCDSVVCQPQCRNGGSCVSPGVCLCPHGYHGQTCEQVSCHKKCLNGGRCWRKNICHCPVGYYGPQCQHHMCAEECQHGGHCIGINKCHCHRRYTGRYCQISTDLLCNKRHSHKKCHILTKMNSYPGVNIYPYEIG